MMSPATFSFSRHAPSEAVAITATVRWRLLCIVFVSFKPLDITVFSLQTAHASSNPRMLHSRRACSSYVSYASSAQASSTAPAPCGTARHSAAHMIAALAPCTSFERSGSRPASSIDDEASLDRSRRASIAALSDAPNREYTRPPPGPTHHAPARRRMPGPSRRLSPNSARCRCPRQTRGTAVAAAPSAPRGTSLARCSRQRLAAAGSCSAPGYSPPDGSRSASSD